MAPSLPPSSLPEGALVGNFGEDLFITYSGDDGNDVVLFTQTAFTADFDLDGAVDSDDLSQWVGDFGANDDSDAEGDLDSDGADFLAWQRQFGLGGPLQAETAKVPEPAAGITMLLGMSAMLIGQRAAVSKLKLS